MFCQNCGDPAQTPDTYCRNCGEFQADSGKPRARRITVYGYFIASGLISLLCILFCFLLAFSHFTRFITSATSDWLTNATITVLIGIGIWNTLNLYFAIKLYKRFEQYRLNAKPPAESKNIDYIGPSELLNPAVDDNIDASAFEDPTKNLAGKVRR